MKRGPLVSRRQYKPVKAGGKQRYASRGVFQDSAVASHENPIALIYLKMANPIFILGMAAIGKAGYILDVKGSVTKVADESVESRR
jgi:hypothetical protein